MEVVIPFLYVWEQHLRQAFGRRTHLRKKRRPRKFLKRATLDDYTEQEACHIFRLSKVAIREVLEQIKSEISSSTKRTNAIPAETKLLAVLHFLASGSFQYCASVKLGVSQPSFSRFFKPVINALVRLSRKYIRFPSRPQEQEDNFAQFYQRAGIPKILGLIDCTHISLVPPATEEDSYRNRKMFHSFNVQVVCGPKMQILDVVAKFPGSTHDSYVLSNSRLYRNFQHNKFGDAMLLGDNGYRNLPWLLTPFLRPATVGESRFNRAHRKTRSLIERLFGILKSRYRCLDVTGGAMLYRPKLVARIIVACCVLHNVANVHNVPIDLSSDLREHIPYQGVYGREGSNAGNRRRQQIVERYFT